MVVLFRVLKRRFFLYKFFIALSICALLMSICYHLFQVSYKTISHSRNCPYEEPIDVVYTWVNGSDPAFTSNLANFVKDEKSSTDFSNQRYDDKYELKFSLRSLEKYAPWINHVYIVTNGQIPYWLNLDYEKVSIITHEEIFKDMSNLPSFSSPAIECNLHRIPGLSRKFIYFNDDIFLGKPTYLEDFYAANRGFLIYLAWPVPPCSNSCPWMYVADGQCDKECLVPECQMDGNDCANINDKIINKEVSTEDLEGNDEDGTPSRVLADTIQKVRSNFYKSFVKKLLPSVNSTAALNITSPKASTKPNQLLRVYNMNNVKNVSKFVNDFNRMTLVNDKTRRSKFKKRKRSYFKAGNRTFYSLLKPSINVDAYSSSLQYTNRMLNGKYGFKTRKVPSHAPILIDTDIMDDLQKVFGKEFELTEKNRVRKENDVQFSFSYYYFVMSEAKTRDVSSIFDEFDTDYSGTWSDREIRTLLTNLYELPLSYAIVDHFEALLLNCSVTGELPEVSTPPYERYIDSKLPTIAKDLVISCPSLSRILTHRFGSVPKYKYEVIHDAESKYVIFKMLNSNISDVVSNLDEIRSNRKKFVCLNDNLDDTKASENALVKAILYDFYVSLFPYPSKFELPDDLRNKFGYMRELNLWKKYRFNIKTYLYFLICLLCFAFYNLCKKKCCQIANKLFY